MKNLLIFLLILLVGAGVLYFVQRDEESSAPAGQETAAQDRPEGLNSYTDVDALARKPADVRLAYGTHPYQFAELRLPAGPGPHPVVVVLHGGCWVTPYVDLTNAGALADALRDEGYATLNVEYRGVDQAGGGWPGTFDDIGAAVDSLRELAENHPLDLGSVAAIGHSAGGHLALWALARPVIPDNSPLYRDNPLELKGAISVGGPGDLLVAREVMSGPCGVEAVTPLLGGENLREVNARWGDPARLLPFPGRQILITGEYDHVAPPHLGEAYAATTAAATHIIVDGAGHHEYLDPGAVTWPVILEAINSILEDEE